MPNVTLLTKCNLSNIVRDVTLLGILNPFSYCLPMFFIWFYQVVETIIKVSPLDGPQVFAPVLLKILNMIIEVEVNFPY